MSAIDDNTKIMSGWQYIESIVIRTLDDGSQEQHHVLTDQAGLIMTRDKAERITAGMQVFYSCISDDEIEEHNNLKRTQYLNHSAMTGVVKKDMSGYIYLIKVGKFHKIGRSKDLKTRIQEFMTTPPFEAEIIKVVHVKNMFRIEGMLHTIFSSKRVKGEWFDLDEIDVRDANCIMVTIGVSIDV